MSDQIFCTLAELVDDLKILGDEPQLYQRIRAASDFIRRRIGDFIPVTAARDFDGKYTPDLYVDPPLLALTAITNNGDTVTAGDCSLYPLGGYYPNGPYTRIHNEDVSWDEAEVTGRWGKYEETEDLGVTVSLAQTTTATLAVTNGSLLSPGMHLLIESEQLLVTGVSTATAATSLLNEDVDDSEEEIDVDNGAEFKAGEVIALGTEDCYIRWVSGNTLIVTRGWNQTTRATHANDLAISVYRTYTVKRAVNGTTAAVHSTKELYRYRVPGDVNWLARQIAGLMRMKARAGFAGRVDNAEGDTTYINEFPGQIKEIKANYRITRL